MTPRSTYALCVTLVLAAAACDRDAGTESPTGSEAATAPAEPKAMSVAEVAAALAAKKVTPVDANGDDVRSAQGTLPGARLLSSPHDFAKDLPTDKAAPLVFYCYNSW